MESEGVGIADSARALDRESLRKLAVLALKFFP